MTFSIVGRGGATGNEEYNELGLIPCCLEKSVFVKVCISSWYFSLIYLSSQTEDSTNVVCFPSWDLSKFWKGHFFNLSMYDQERDNKNGCSIV